MKELVVISGKGGTGKTSIVAAFAALAKQAVFADCDVDAADLHLILKPQIKQTHDFSGGKIASVITDKCIGCGRCEQVCHFGATSFTGLANDIVDKTYEINPIDCEGCGVCTHFCPVDAIDFADAINGQWYESDTRFGPMVHAKLGAAEENSGKLVTLIRQQAKRIAIEQNRNLLISDGSPGIGCPVIASITGADMVLVVTEPTESGKHDLYRVLELTGHFKIPTALCINKADLNDKVAKQIESTAAERSIPVIGRIAYDETFTKAQIAAKAVTELVDEPLAKTISTLWEKMLSTLH